MGTVKTTVNLDEETWRKFKRSASNIDDGDKNLGELIEEAIKTYDVIQILDDLAAELGVSIDTVPSSEDITRNRPDGGGSSVDIIREMRRTREDHLSRH